jgi:hypothetical protein
MANVLAVLTILVNDAIKDIHVVEYTRERIKARTCFAGWGIVITLIAKDYPEWFPNGFPTSPDGGMPDRMKFTKHILFWDVHLTITKEDWETMLTILKARNLI